MLRFVLVVALMAGWFVLLDRAVEVLIADVPCATDSCVGCVDDCLAGVSL